MDEMKTLTIGDKTYEIVDQKARTDKLDSSELPKAIDTALAQAKGSGQFNGEDGYTPVRGTDYWTEEDVNTIKSYVNSLLEPVTQDEYDALVAAGTVDETKFYFVG